MTVLGRITTRLHYLCLVFAVWFSLCFAYIALMSLTHPFHLEWMEGHTVDIIRRVREGLPLYVKPSLEYVPYLYTPLYFYVSAFISFFTGIDFTAGRLVSLLSTFGSAWVLYIWIRKEGGNRIIGAITAGLFLATYKLSGRWFDVARIDSLYVFLMMAGLYAFYFGQGRKQCFLAGALFAAAFFTKQSALIALFPAFFAALVIDRRAALLTGSVAACLMLAGCYLLQSGSAGWFGFYIYDVPAGHKNDPRQIAAFWTRDLLPHGFVMLAASLSFLVYSAFRDRRKCLWYACLALGFIGSAWLSRIHSFGHVNVLIPAYLALVLMTGLLLAWGQGRLPILMAALAAGLVFQFYSLLYNPKPLIPHEGARERGERLLAEIASIKGDVLIAELQGFQPRVGKKNYSIGMAGFDILRADLGEKNHIRHEYQRDISQAVRQKRFAAILMGSFLKVPGLTEHYRLEKTLRNPQEFVSGAVYFNKAQLYVPLQKE